MRSLLITGATGGLGAEVVRQLRDEYDVVALYRSPAGFAELNVRGVQADLSDSASVRAAVQSIGTPYGLVHLAGGFAPGSLADTSDETWAKMLDLNLTGAFYAIRETLAVMDRNAPGRILVISSDAARTKAAGSVAYTVSKGALDVMIEVLAKELKSTRITANALLPTSLDTPAMRGEMPREKLVPLDRVAATLRFLLSDAGASVNGALIPLSAR
ncbi:MAG TPA: SDR family NAD(P)-dependent oxidoreductase [Thermoanaerobaculia bacterium]